MNPDEVSKLLKDKHQWKFKLRFLPEFVEFCAYLCFWLLSFTGVILTKYFSSIDPENSLLKNVFGWNNICMNYDTPPSTYFLPAFWACNLLLFELDAFISYLNFVRKFGYSQTIFVLKIFEALCWIVVSTIFAVSPEGPDHTLWIHTIPYLILLIGIMVKTTTATVFDIKSRSWAYIIGHDNVQFDSIFKYGLCFIQFLIITTTVLKICMTTNILAGMESTCVPQVHGSGWDHCDGLWLSRSKTLDIIFGIIDKIWLLVIAIWPLIRSSLRMMFSSVEEEVCFEIKFAEYEQDNQEMQNIS